MGKSGNQGAVSSSRRLLPSKPESLSQGPSPQGSPASRALRDQLSAYDILVVVKADFVSWKPSLAAPALGGNS